MGIAFECDKCLNLYRGYPFLLEVRGEGGNVDLHAELCRACKENIRDIINANSEFSLSAILNRPPETLSSNTKSAKAKE